MSRRQVMVVALGMLVMFLTTLAFVSFVVFDAAGAVISFSALSTPPATPSPRAPASLRATPLANTCNDLLVLVDKTYALPADYVPPDLVNLQAYGIPVAAASLQGRHVMITDLQRLFRDAANANVNLIVDSPYRSYTEQAALYASYVQQYGEVTANHFSAKPGHSQHQLGTAIDFSTIEIADRLDQSFATTKAGKWLLANAYMYGFYLSYPLGEEAITGYEYEPWHFRYVGVTNALAIYQSGLIMQTYLDKYGSRPHCTPRRGG